MCPIIIAACLFVGCKHESYEPDCVCSNLEDFSAAKDYGIQEAKIRINPPVNLSIRPKIIFINGGGGLYNLCTDSFMIKQIALKNIKDGDSVILKGVRSYPTETCNVYHTRTIIKNYFAVELPLPMIRATDIEKK